MTQRPLSEKRLKRLTIQTLNFDDCDVKSETGSSISLRSSEMRKGKRTRSSKAEPKDKVQKCFKRTEDIIQLIEDSALKKDHGDYPLFVCRDGLIILDANHWTMTDDINEFMNQTTNNPIIKKSVTTIRELKRIIQRENNNNNKKNNNNNNKENNNNNNNNNNNKKNTTEFLVSISEPVSRPMRYHHYQITPYSLYTAISLATDFNKSNIAEDIIKRLDSYSKNVLHSDIVTFIRTRGSRLGKLRISYTSQKYYLESEDIKSLEVVTTNHKTRNLILTDISTRGNDKKIYSVQVNASGIEQLKETAYKEFDLPITHEMEYDDFYANSGGNLDIQLKSSTVVRPYQTEAVNRIFKGGRVRSGIIVLPCGAGKTLVGVVATAKVKKRTMILTTTAVAVDQWKRHFLDFCSIPEDSVITLTAEEKSPITTKPVVLISTYSMFSVSYERMSRETKAVFDLVSKLDWYLLIADEVQVMPAKTFRSVVTTVRSKCKIGLSATLVREDSLVDDLQYLIGPKLYEANWQDLVKEGYLANVQCLEVWCEFPLQFFEAYRNASNYQIKKALYTHNPMKLNSCDYLVSLHEARGDKIIVFCDTISLLKEMATRTKKPFICGIVPMQERMACISCFKNSNKLNVIYISQVGDNAIDIPNANVIIQINSHFGSRRQEAQRLGRILRPKDYVDKQGYNAYFYSLVTVDTMEKSFAEKRQRFLADQGYSFKIITHFKNIIEDAERRGDEFVYSKSEDQNELLKVCLLTMDQRSETEQSLSICDSGLKLNPEDENLYLSRYSVPEEEQKKHRQFNMSMDDISGAYNNSYDDSF